ncbi:MAG: DUF1045 domain-containing protein [Cypionkella sp.]|uniref:DUF1045 domain-containing protein n=1 Tax=Cypionkella sp. TaxID=2811411 RepID=UPI002726EFE0|nr:DUF1045 domain-containing protein [Cypionkella sp.]MDO8325539.1 DUF1045 domain-containing protein [Cypionkella sp.]
MEQMKRYAIYYAPEAGAFADAAAAWLGWDVRAGQAVAQPQLDLPRPLADITAEPRKYGFHGTIKPPFRLAEAVTPDLLHDAVASLAASLRPVALPGLQMVNLEGFLALIPQGDTAALQALAAEVVRVLDPYRAPLTAAEIARRRPDRLTPRQRDLLAVYGYPYVMEEFRFHLTLSGPLGGDEAAITEAATRHFAGVVPQPFRLADLCLFGEDAMGRFHLLHRYALTA